MADKYSDYDSRSLFKEAVCIDANRVYDSCSDRDCLEDIRVYIPADQQIIVDNARDVRIRNVCVITVLTDLQELPFNKGYFTVDLTFFLDVTIELIGAPGTPVIPVSGVAAFTKKCVMYGGEGGVKTFYSDMEYCSPNMFGTTSQPRVGVQVADPIALDAKLCDCCNMGPCCCPPDDLDRLPRCVAEHFGPFNLMPNGKVVYATIGLFMIVQMSRNVQMMMPAYDFCIPTKECCYNVGPETSACDLFSQIDFPTNEFFPPKTNTDNGNGGGSGSGCGCR